MKQIITIPFIFSFLLSACNSSTSTIPSQPSPTIIQVSTPTIAITATPTNTSTPKPTATKEIKQYPICTAENYSECVIPYQDLFNGDYYNWLNTLPIDPFDASKVEQVQCYGNSRELTFVGNPSKNNFSNPETSMIRRGITLGVTTVTPEEISWLPQIRNYLILPVYAYSQSKGTGVWVTLFLRSDGMTKLETDNFVIKWIKIGNLLIITDLYGSYKFSGQKNTPTPYQREPLVVDAYDLYPDLQLRLDNFGMNCDLGFISAPGILFETSYTR